MNRNAMNALDEKFGTKYGHHNENADHDQPAHRLRGEFDLKVEGEVYCYGCDLYYPGKEGEPMK
jgi:hypothetical protein